MQYVAQRDVVLVGFDPARGHEQRGTRPAIVISGNAFHISGVCIVVPVTSKIKNFFANIHISPSNKNGMKKKSEVLVGQVRVVDQERCVKKVGVITDQQLQRIFTGLDNIMDR